MCKLRIAGTINDSITDGPGLRYTIFLQGCPHHCEECHNPQTWNLNGGSIIDSSNILQEIKENPLLQGVTFSGGEPLLQAENLINLAKEIKKLNLNLAIYTGFTFEEIIENNNSFQLELLKIADVLVDGRYDKNKRDYMLKFCGSSNQRIIDLQQTIKFNKIILETSSKWNN